MTEAVPNEQKEKLLPKYTLAITEQSDNEGVRKCYTPVLVEKTNDVYQQWQCGFDSFEGSLDDVLARAKVFVKEDQDSGNYLSVYSQTPEELAAHRPNEAEFVFPKESK